MRQMKTTVIEPKKIATFDAESGQALRQFLKLQHNLLSVSDSQPINDLRRWLDYNNFSHEAELCKRLYLISADQQRMVREALSSGQVESKIWLVRKLAESIDRKVSQVFIMAGWVGVLALIMNRLWPGGWDNIRSFDVNPECEAIAETLNKLLVIDAWRFKAVTADIRELDLTCEKSISYDDGSILTLRSHPDLVINTSCEHIVDFDAWWELVPENTLVALQNNNYFSHHEHVNCVENLADFRKMCPLKRTLYTGSLATEKYTRFMLIGYK